MKGKLLIQVNVAFGAKQQLGAVPGNIYMHCDFFLLPAEMHFGPLRKVFESRSQSFSRLHSSSRIQDRPAGQSNDKKKNEVMIEPVFTSLSRDSVQCGERSPSAQVF